MKDTATAILRALSQHGEMTLEQVAAVVPRKFNDHRDFYPLASLLSQGLVEDWIDRSFNERDSTPSHLPNHQVLAWKLYAMSSADKTAQYKGRSWSIHGGAETLKGQTLALTGAGYLRLEESSARRSERAFAVFIAVASAAMTGFFTFLFSVK